MSDTSHITQLLQESNSGNLEARNEILDLLYQELHRIAQRHGRDRGKTLRPTALVNEVYIKLFKGEQEFADRKNLLAYAAIAMRQIVLNYAEKSKAAKRGGNRIKVTFEENDSLPDTDFGKLNEVLEMLEEKHPRQAKILNLSYFAGFSKEEIAELLEVGESTVYRDLKFAKAWIYKKLKPKGDGAG